MTSNLVANQFDRISRVYDETRRPLKDAAVDKIVSILSRDGCTSIIEIGVGTGRIAKPLQERGLRTVGVDISKGMLLKAREKKIRELILADANNLPIREKSFDGAIFAHVLHIFEDPNGVFKKVVNVVRKEVIALVPKPTESQDNRDEIRGTVRLLFQEASAKLGYTLSLGGEGRRQKESDLLASLPPSELIDIQDELIETSISERLSYFEKRANRHTLELPEDVLQKIMREVRSSLPTETVDKKVRYRRVEQLAIWKFS